MWLCWPKIFFIIILNCKLWDKFLNSMIILNFIISYILMFYRNFELIFEFMALKRTPICGRKFALLSFWVFLYVIVKILFEGNKKNLTLCQNNEKWTKKKSKLFKIHTLDYEKGVIKLNQHKNYSSDLSDF